MHEDFEFILTEIKKLGGWDQESAGRLAMHLQTLDVKKQIAHSLMRIDEHFKVIEGSLEGSSHHLFETNYVIKEGLSDVVDILDKIRRYYKGI